MDWLAQTETDVEKMLPLPLAAVKLVSSKVNGCFAELVGHLHRSAGERWWTAGKNTTS